MPQESFVFAQFLRLLPRAEFLRIVKKYKGDYRTRHFRCWDQLACMMFGHIRQESSLRDMDIALNAHASKLFITWASINARSPPWPMRTNTVTTACTRSSPNR